jgi:hypothetical protein
MNRAKNANQSPQKVRESVPLAALGVASSAVLTFSAPSIVKPAEVAVSVLLLFLAAHSARYGVLRSIWPALLISALLSLVSVLGANRGERFSWFYLAPSLLLIAAAISTWRKGRHAAKDGADAV